MIRAEIHRPNLGSLAYVWIGDREYVAASTSQAHALLNRRGRVEHVDTLQNGGGTVERYIITKQEKEA
ncbi:MAG: hypothetical protein EBR95_10945 [Verrucomicrobia bacterium]|jgi:hypothetical protein|nr:hypothetical protein [Verrucomicrobiota bacterium]